MLIEFDLVYSNLINSHCSIMFTYFLNAMSYTKKAHLIKDGPSRD